MPGGVAFRTSTLERLNACLKPAMVLRCVDEVDRWPDGTGLEEMLDCRNMARFFAHWYPHGDAPGVYGKWRGPPAFFLSLHMGSLTLFVRSRLLQNVCACGGIDVRGHAERFRSDELSSTIEFESKTLAHQRV